MMLKLKARNQITISRDMRRKLNIKAGDRPLVNTQDGVIVLTPDPRQYTDYLQGLHSNIWKGVDVQKYLEDERGAWEKPEDN